jgi:hypothetical protein
MDEVRIMMALIEPKDDKLYLQYTRSLELALTILSKNEMVKFGSMSELSTYLGCADNQTGIKVLQQICKRYHIRCQFNDDGIRLSNANININNSANF